MGNLFCYQVPFKFYNININYLKKGDTFNPWWLDLPPLVGFLMSHYNYEGATVHASSFTALEESVKCNEAL